MTDRDFEITCVSDRLIYADWLDESGRLEEACLQRELAAGKQFGALLLDIITGGDQKHHLSLPKADQEHLAVQSIAGGYELRFGAMYEAPGISLALLESLGRLFGTTSIDVDGYAESGCESCDYGSDYGHSIQIRNITRNERELMALVGAGCITSPG